MNATEAQSELLAAASAIDGPSDEGTFKHDLRSAADVIRRQEDRIDDLYQDRSYLLEALTPSAETKAAYAAEFHFQGPEYLDEDGNPQSDRHMVPWTTIKEVMAMIRGRAEASMYRSAASNTEAPPNGDQA